MATATHGAQIQLGAMPPSARPAPASIAPQPPSPGGSHNLTNTSTSSPLPPYTPTAVLPHNAVVGTTPSLPGQTLRRCLHIQPITILITIIGIALPVVGLPYAIQSIKDSHEALNLSKWTAKKDFEKYCQTLRSDGSEAGSGCPTNHTSSLAPPPLLKRGFDTLQAFCDDLGWYANDVVKDWRAIAGLIPVTGAILLGIWKLRDPAIRRRVHETMLNQTMSIIVNGVSLVRATFLAFSGRDYLNVRNWWLWQRRDNGIYPDLHQNANFCPPDNPMTVLVEHPSMENVLLCDTGAPEPTSQPEQEETQVTVRAQRNCDTLSQASIEVQLGSGSEAKRKSLPRRAIGEFLKFLQELDKAEAELSPQGAGPSSIHIELPSRAFRGDAVSTSRTIDSNPEVHRLSRRQQKAVPNKAA